MGFNGADTVATFTPANSLAAGVTYTATVSGAQNASGTAMSGPYSWSFTTAGPAVPVQYLAGRHADRVVRVERPAARRRWGVRFQASSSGFIAGVRFYKEVG